MADGTTEVHSCNTASTEAAERTSEPAEARSGSVEGSSGVSRRAFVGTAALAGASLVSAGSALAQSRKESEQGRTGDYASDPGPENRAIQAINPDATIPPFTDHGNPPPFWYSYPLTAKRLQGGGWTRQITSAKFRNPRSLRA